MVELVWTSSAVFVQQHFAGSSENGAEMSDNSKATGMQRFQRTKKTQKCFQQFCMQPNHRTNFACALPRAWQTSSRRAILWLLNTSHKTELFRTLGGTFSSLHLWIYSSALQIWFFLFIPCFSLCCEPLGESWGKDSKLLCSICVFTSSLGRNAHNFFKFKKVSRLRYSGAAWRTKTATVTPHSDLCTLLASACGPTSGQGRAVTCLVVWLLSVIESAQMWLIAIATCQPFWIELCLAFRLCDQLINWIA